MIGVAMKHCIEVGLHRKMPARANDLGYELDKRLFWTCYRLDRHTAISTGRPFSLADFDIDVPVRVHYLTYRWDLAVLTKPSCRWTSTKI
jgi:hypothetical protein